MMWAVVYNFHCGFPTIEWCASWGEAIHRAVVLGGDAVVRSLFLET